MDRRQEERSQNLQEAANQDEEEKKQPENRQDIEEEKKQGERRQCTQQNMGQQDQEQGLADMQVFEYDDYSDGQQRLQQDLVSISERPEQSEEDSWPRQSVMGQDNSRNLDKQEDHDVHVDSVHELDRDCQSQKHKTKMHLNNYDKHELQKSMSMQMKASYRINEYQQQNPLQASQQSNESQEHDYDENQIQVVNHHPDQQQQQIQEQQNDDNNQEVAGEREAVDREQQNMMIVVHNGQEAANVVR